MTSSDKFVSDLLGTRLRMIFSRPQIVPMFSLFSGEETLHYLSFIIRVLTADKKIRAALPRNSEYPNRHFAHNYLISLLNRSSLRN